MKNLIKRLVRESLGKNKIDYRVEHLASYDGQDNYELGMYVDNQIVGLIQYTTFEGELSISDILVRPELRRKGYASRMVKVMKSKHPDEKYVSSMKTDLGAKFKHKDVNPDNLDENEDWEDGDDFSPTIPDRVKDNSNRYVGRAVTWYGDPQQMIVVHKDYVDGMFGNIYNYEKMENLVDLIRNHEDNVEIECTYAHISGIDFTDVLEQQQSHKNGDFERDYEGTRNMASIGDEELDDYIGSDELDDSELMQYENYDEYDLYELLNNNRFYLVYGKTDDYIKSLVSNLNTKNIEEIGEPLTERDYEYLKTFMEIEHRIANAVRDEDGDINTYRIQLRDGHHRVMGAIEAGENHICVNLDKESIQEYGDIINNLNYINKVR